MKKSSGLKATPFTGYEKFVVALLAFLQFTIILDFMIVSPLGPMLMPALKITPAQFGFVVSVYAFSAGTAGILAAGFADRFDRKRLLLFFYAGFLLGTLMCGAVDSFEALVAARLVTGLFGGVIGSIIFAIIADLFPLEKRGRVMGFVQTAFAASQVLGLPVGLAIANQWGWKSPFFMIVGVGLLAGIAIVLRLRPIDAHLGLPKERNPLRHLFATVSKGEYALPFATTALLSIGGFMLMPLGSAYTVHNLGIAMADLPLIYLVSGACSILIGPLVGRACDSFGNKRVFVFGTLASIVMVLIYTNLGVTPLSLVILVNVLMFIGVFSRMIPSQTVMSTIPTPANRGAFMAVSSSLQQVAGGFAAILAGMLVIELPGGKLEHFDRIGYVMVGTSLASLVMMNLILRKRPEPVRAGLAVGVEGGH